MSYVAASALFTAALIFVGLRCWREQRPPDNLRDPARSAFCDFQDVVYYPARAAFAGVNPYDPRPADEGGKYFATYAAGNSFPLYAPVIWVASLPFTVWELTTAQFLYWVFKFALLVFYACLLLRIREQPVAASGVLVLTAVLLLSRPGHADFYFGNVAVPMVLATVGSWWLADRRPWAAGVLLAVACIKPTFGGPLFVLLLLRGSYRAAVIGFLLAVIVNLAVVGTLLPQLLNANYLLEMVRTNQATMEANEAVDPLLSGSRVDLLMVVERLIGRHLPNAVRYALTLGTLIVAGLAIRKLKTPPDEAGRRAEYDSLALASLTIALCIYHNIYDALLVAPAALAAFANLSRNKTDAQRSEQWLLLALLLVPAVSYFTSTKFLAIVAEMMPPLASAVQQPALWTMLCVLNGVCLTAAWIILIVRCFRKAELAPAQASK
jgi:hypothetical protein